MLQALWTSKTGLETQQQKLDVISNNLANSSTRGFKKQHAIFEDLLYQQIREPGGPSTNQTNIPSGIQIGLGSKFVANPKDFAQGALQSTGNQLDLAIQGAGLLAIQMPDGTIAYTRDGSLQKDAQGQLVTQSGYVVAPGITIPNNATNITIGKDGVVSVSLPNNTITQVGQLNLTQFINYAGLKALGENLFAETPASGTAQESVPGTNGVGTLAQGFTEASNVNVVEELISMIETQRSYELNSKAISTADQMLAKLSQLS